MNQRPAKRPLFRLSLTADSADKLDQVVDNLPELVFRSPATKEIFGSKTFLILIAAFGFPVVLTGVLAVVTGNPPKILALLVLSASVLFSFVVYLLLRNGCVILKSDRLVEYNILNSPRVISYAQIFEVKPGTHADQVWIRYYATDRNGQIDFKSIKGRNLMPVREASELRHELKQRVSAPAPLLSQRASPILILLLLGLLVIPVVGSLIYLFFEAFFQR